MLNNEHNLPRPFGTSRVKSASESSYEDAREDKKQPLSQRRIKRRMRRVILLRVLEKREGISDNKEPKAPFWRTI